MSLLSDADLERALELGDFTQAAGLPPGGLRVTPLGLGAIQPASIDLRLGGQFRYWPHPFGPGYDGLAAWTPGGPFIDPMAPEGGGLTMLTATLDRHGDTFDVLPGQFILAHTYEEVAVGGCLAVQVYGKSSIGRLGLEVENAGYVDPGFIGQITLELKNSTYFPIRLTVGMPICQIVAHRLTSPARVPYGTDRASRYQGQLGATPSRYGKNRAQIGQG